MSRKRTGLHNRYRQGGRSTYARHRKATTRDSYGAWSGGRQDKPDVIAGRTLHYRDRIPSPLETGATQ